MPSRLLLSKCLVTRILSDIFYTSLFFFSSAKNEASADSDIFVGLDVSPELQHKLLERFSRRLISHPVKPIAKTDEASVRDVKEAQRSDVIVEGAAPGELTCHHYIEKQNFSLQ